MSWQLVSTALLAITLAGAAYLVLAVCCLAVFARRPRANASEYLPSFTILKPIAGAEPQLYENLASFCRQEYGGPFEVVFCLHDETDSAMAVVERVVNDFPNVRTRIAIGHNSGCRNPKIANLTKPGAEPTGEIVVIADSDVRVGRDYLRALAACFSSSGTGAATCLYGGIPNASLVSRLGALYIEDGFIPSVLVALALGKLRFCLGATMAVPARVLEDIGGLTGLGSHLADDHALGSLVTANGYEVVLSRYVVRTMVAEKTLGELWNHELRWARTNFALAPAGYAFSFLMYALPFALLYLLVSRNFAFALPLLAVVAGLRLGVHYLSRKALGTTRAEDATLIPLRDGLSLALWAASLFGRRVRWRERDYKV